MTDQESSGDMDNGVEKEEGERERGALAAWNQFHMMSDRLSWNHYTTPRDKGML